MKKLVALCVGMALAGSLSLSLGTIQVSADFMDDETDIIRSDCDGLTREQCKERMHKKWAKFSKKWKKMWKKFRPSPMECPEGQVWMSIMADPTDDDWMDLPNVIHGACVTVDGTNPCNCPNPKFWRKLRPDWNKYLPPENPCPDGQVLVEIPNKDYEAFDQVDVIHTMCVDENLVDENGCVVPLN